MRKFSKALGFFGVLGLSAFLSTCSNPVSSGSASSSASTSQAAYATLDTSSSTAWAAAVAAGNVRPGTVLVKTNANFSTASLTALGATQTGTLAGIRGTWRHLSVTSGTEGTTIAALRQVAGVLAAQPEMRLHLPESTSSATKAGGLPAALITSSLGARSIISGYGLTTYYDDVFTDPDPYLASAQYSLSITKALQAYDPANYPLGSKTAYAAVIDTGLNMAHEEFYDSSGNSIVVRARSAFTRNNATSYTYVGDESSTYTAGSATNFIDETIGQNWDDDGHGTHVAGIVGAVGNNGKGIAGVMWSGLKLITYKVITDNETDSENGSGSDWAVYGALADLTAWWSTASNHSASTQVTLPVNMSLGGYYADQFEAEMLSYALQNNVVVIAAMGNDGKITAEYPGAYTGVIAVGATTGADTAASFTTQGSWMSVSAPGLDILSSYNGSTSDYEYDSGTSMATPFVTGLSAYALAYSPTLLPDQLKTVLMNSADSLGGSSSTNVSTSYGAGRVNVYNTLYNAQNNVPGSGSVYSAYPITVTVTVRSTATANIPVYLYDSTGSTFCQVGYTGSTGAVSFWLLKPGSYLAKANNGSAVAQSTVIILTSSATTPANPSITF